MTVETLKTLYAVSRVLLVVEAWLIHTHRQRNYLKCASVRQDSARAGWRDRNKDFGVFLNGRKTKAEFRSDKLRERETQITEVCMTDREGREHVNQKEKRSRE